MPFLYSQFFLVRVGIFSEPIPPRLRSESGRLESRSFPDIQASHSRFDSLVVSKFSISSDKSKRPSSFKYIFSLFLIKIILTMFVLYCQIKEANRNQKVFSTFTLSILFPNENSLLEVESKNLSFLQIAAFLVMYLQARGTVVFNRKRRFLIIPFLQVFNYCIWPFVFLMIE